MAIRTQPGPAVSPLEDTTQRQAAAADPAACAWVSANAGTGKTYVLVRRVLRCLLAGAAPEGILCLTYTKAAAAEMENRLTGELAAWAVLTQDALKAELRALLGREPQADEVMLAGSLFTRVLDAPGGLKFMTIHGFCSRILKRFPLEGELPPGFRVLTDDEKAAIIEQSVEAVLGQALSQEGELHDALQGLIAHVSEDGFTRLAAEMVAKRRVLKSIIAAQAGDEGMFAGLRRALCEAIGAPSHLNAGDIIEQQLALCPDALLAACAALAASSKPTDQKTADRLTGARMLRGEMRREALAEAFLTQQGTARTNQSFLTKDVQHAHPALSETLLAARGRFAELEMQRRAAVTVEASLALTRLADAIIAHYDTAKRGLNAADHDDLIDKTLSLLTRQSAQWVLYQIDTAIRHVLIDEAQDTNPEQWEVIRRLSEEFFAGSGAVEETRTVFAVGDEKQSIFGFQGAAPEQFAKFGGIFRAQAETAGMVWHGVPLRLSFRTAAPVLRAVDLVFGRLEGFAPPGQSIVHHAFREGEAGLVEVWPIERGQQAVKGEAWQPFNDAAAIASPQQRIVARIAATIGDWLDSKEVLASRGRPIEPGDILILLRKREPLSRLIIRALQERGIPVAGADRLKLGDHIAIADLVALGEALLQPRDDLALACVLKSPLFDWREDELYHAAHGRDASLHQAIQARAGSDAKCASVAAKLRDWREDALHLTPFAFYSKRLDCEGLRHRFLARLGSEAGDAIAEFLNLALAFETANAPTLQSFLHWFQQSGAEIKRDLDKGRNEVRVMTVHGAKGLEADIVFLPDTCSTKGRKASEIAEIPLPGARPDMPPLPVYAIPAAKNLSAMVAAREAVKQAEASEYRRLLYVAMTRARDRLYVTGFEGSKGRNQGCWYDLIQAGLGDHAETVTTPRGDRILRMSCAQTRPVEAPARITAPAQPGRQPLPDWLVKPAPALSAPSPLTPSGVGEPVAVAAPQPLSPDAAALRGRLAHRLLEMLPRLPAAERFEAGMGCLAGEGAGLAAHDHAAFIKHILTIIEKPDFAGLFGPGSCAEAAIQALVARPQADRPPLLITGQIDRLVVRDHDILIVDYKTGGPVPKTYQKAPAAYLRQLAAYGLAVEKLYPGKALDAAILWVEAAHLMRIPRTVLAAMQQEILGSVSGALDAGEEAT